MIKNTKLILLMLMLLFLSCGRSHDNTTETGTINFTLEWARPPQMSATSALRAPSPDVCVDYGITTITATVSDSASNELASASWNCSAHAGSMPGVPVGFNLQFQIEGKDAGGVVLWRGQKTQINLTADQPFSTGAVTMTYIGDDTTPPAVVSVTPAANSVNVPVTSTITAKFSEPMSLSSIIASTFTLSTGSSILVSGLVAYNASTNSAAFTPALNLAYSASYTAKLSGVKDMSGLALQSAYIWSFTTEAAAASAPTAPTLSITPDTTNKQATLSWPAVSGASSYNLYKATTPGVTTSSTKVVGVSSPLLQTGLANNTSYYYALTAANGIGESGLSSEVSISIPVADTSSPSVPVGLTATAASSAQIDLTWTASTDNVAVTGYKIYRGGTYLKIVTGITTSDTGLTAATNYCYTVSAIDAATNESSKSTQACVTTSAAVDTTAPSVPGGLTATAASASQIDLSWTASTDNVAVTGYKIYRGGTYLKTVTGITASDTGLTASTNYCYTVSAIDGANNESSKSTQACVTTSAPYTTGINYNVPDTNQTTVYTTGDDGSYLINAPSYTDNNNGTITDNVTGLVWQKQDDATTRTWDAANTYCSNLSLPGTGWRLPTDFELETIVDFGKYSPSINTTYFPGTRSSYYWSSTTLAGSTTGAWVVYFYYGFSYFDGKASSGYVRCVR